MYSHDTSYLPYFQLKVQQVISHQQKHIQEYLLTITTAADANLVTSFLIFERNKE